MLHGSGSFSLSSVLGRNPEMIEIKNRSFCYQNAQENALKDVSLWIKPGECVVLCGKSGCGKTTLARLLN